MREFHDVRGRVQANTKRRYAAPERKRRLRYQQSRRGIELESACGEDALDWSVVATREYKEYDGPQITQRRSFWSV
jgi:hypothetical protein